MATAKVTSKKTEIEPTQIDTGTAEFCIFGKTPLIYNSPSFKAMGFLLKPSKKTAAEKETTLKHLPMEEYVNSTIRRRPGEAGPTRLLGPTRWFKGCVSDVATRIPGVTKAAMEQLVWMAGDHFDMHGVPQILMSWVRSSDMARTPDVRTRAILPQWACRVRFYYVKPHIDTERLAKLLGSAGILNGVGDFRQQKGAGNYGQFELVNADDPRFRQVVKNSSMEIQDEALANPVCYDQVTEDLLNWFNDQVRGREDRDDGPVAEAAE